jgi:hypothetical protein
MLLVVQRALSRKEAPFNKAIFQWKQAMTIIHHARTHKCGKNLATPQTAPKPLEIALVLFQKLDILLKVLLRAA